MHPRARTGRVTGHTLDPQADRVSVQPEIERPPECREKFGYARDRGGSLIQQPSRRWAERPIVLLINQNSFSDAELFPAGFKALNLGTIMGVPTSGGVIGTVEYPLIDGTTWMRIPRVGWYTVEMQNTENLGIQPDIWVDQDLNHIRQGFDDQLHAAVNYLVAKIQFDGRETVLP